MPELPEVEVVARSLAPQLIGRTITAVAKLDWERMIETPDPARFRELIAGRRIQAVGRRAKWVVISLDDAWTLAIHLRMSGNLVVQAAEATPDQYTHLVLALDDGRRLFFEDQRKFGRVRLLDPIGLAALDSAHGPEPLDPAFTVDALAAILARQRTKLKPLLLDQARIAGLGNIYVSEALWIARLHPLLPAAATPSERIPLLHSAIRSVLEQAIANEGSSLRNYRNGYGRRGSNQDHFLVYNRTGAPCQRCGTPIERIVVAQRSTFYCPSCQVLDS
jgi:formamidopyrimidine-DNA glycosylase